MKKGGGKERWIAHSINPTVFIPRLDLRQPLLDPMPSSRNSLLPAHSTNRWLLSGGTAPPPYRLS